MTGALTKRRNLNTTTEILGKCSIKIGVRLPQAKEGQRLPANHQKLGGMGHILHFEPSERTNPAATFISDFQPPGLGDNKCLLFEPPRLW